MSNESRIPGCERDSSEFDALIWEDLSQRKHELGIAIELTLDEQEAFLRDREYRRRKETEGKTVSKDDDSPPDLNV